MPSSVPCRLCGQFFRDNSALAKHDRESSHIDLIWRCEDVCGRAFERCNELYYHKATAPLHHKLDEYKGIDEWSGEAVLQCRDCDLTFHETASLYSHLKDRFHSMTEEDLLPYGSTAPDRLKVREEVARLCREEGKCIGRALGMAIAQSIQQPTQQSTQNLLAPAIAAAAAATTATILGQDDTTAGLPVFGPPTLAEAFDTMAADIATMKVKLQATADQLEHQKELHQCGMCYENEVNCVAQCGHQFCVVCVKAWCDAKLSNNPFNIPCPTCRTPMGHVIRTFNCEA